MKKTLLVSLCALLFSLSSFSSVNGPLIVLNKKFQGTFVSEKTIYFFNYLTEQECLANGGAFQDNTCEFPAEDEVKVKKLKKTLYEVEVSTIGTNAHSCVFVDRAQPVSSDTLLAQDEETGCHLTLHYRGNNELSVDSNNKCRDFCGARAHLYIEKAERQ